MQLRYRCRLYPTPGQRRSLARAFGCARVVFNDAVAARRDAHRAGEKHPSSGVLQKRLITQEKKTPGRAWLAGVSAPMLQQAVRDCDQAYANFFNSLKGQRKGRKVSAPRFKSRKDRRQAVRFTHADKFRITAGGKLHLPKVGDVNVVWSRDLPSPASSVTIIRTADGRYYASFVVETGDETQPPVLTQDGGEVECALDLGLNSFAVDQHGLVIDNPRVLRRAERRLKKAQRELSRKQRGSANREKARRKVARRHAKVADTRADWLHKETSRLIGENQVVYLEDLNVAGLSRTRMAKPVQDASWCQFRRLLEEKAARYGRAVVVVGRFEPTSQVCSTCGVRDGPKPLSVRTWTCGACGAAHDRDANAAKNILAAGRTERLNACGADVRPPSGAVGGEAGTHRGHQQAGGSPAPAGAVGIAALQGGEDVKRHDY